MYETTTDRLIAYVWKASRALSAMFGRLLLYDGSVMDNLGTANRHGVWFLFSRTLKWYKFVLQWKCDD